MNLVDSSGWLEYFANGKNSKYFAAPIEDIKNLIVPSICIYEVFKKILLQRSDNEALQAAGLMHQGKVIMLDTTLSLNAARLSVNFKLPMADSIIFATAQAHDAVIWTQDADFKNLKNVKYIS